MKATPTKKQIIWDDVLSKSFDELKPVSTEFSTVLDSKDLKEMAKVADLRALDVSDCDFRETEEEEIFKYIKDKLERHEIDPDVAKVMLDSFSIDGKLPARFQRVFNDKSTGMYIHGNGTIFESVYVFPNDERLRIFHSMFNDPDRKTLAEKAQTFFYELVGYVKAQVGNKIDYDSNYIAERIAKADPVKPLSANGKRISNIFLGKSDLSDIVANTNINTEINYLVEVNDIDLITGIFSSQFKQGKGKTFFYNGLIARLFDNPIVPEVDYKKQVLVEMLLKIDPSLVKRLEEKGIVQNGEIIDKKTFAKLFYEGADTPQAAVLELLGEQLDVPRVFANKDPNLSNIMLRQNSTSHYAYIDFESYVQEDIISVIAKRMISAGLYDYRGESLKLNDGTHVEDYLLDKAYQTYVVANRVTSQPVLSRKDFNKQIQFQKNKYLLRTARRFKLQEAVDKTPKKIQELTRYFFTLLHNEFLKQGFDDSHPGLAYLNQLFPETLSEEDMKRIFDSDECGNPAYTISRHFKPRNLEDALRITDKKINKVMREKKARTWRKRFLVGGLAACLTAMAVGTSIYQKLVNSLNKDIAQSKKELSMKSNYHIIREFLKFMNCKKYEYKGDLRKKFWKYESEFIFAQRETGEMVSARYLCKYYKRLGDPVTACVAYIDPYSFVKAIDQLGLKEKFDKKKAIPYDLIKDKIKEIDPDLYWVARDANCMLVDSWARNPYAWSHPHDIMENHVYDNLRKAWERLDTEKKAAEIKAQHEIDMSTPPSLMGFVGSKSRPVTMGAYLPTNSEKMNSE